MNLYVAICLLAVTASAKADGALGLGGLGGLVYAPGHASADYYAYPRYAFEYSVKDPHTGDNKAQWEKRDGDVVKGAYSLVEPDGSLRVVEYFADDKSGFNAVVKRLGPNLHPTSVHAAPIYKAPIPVLGHGSALSPISVGPVANLGHLASAPLISGPNYGPALSTQNLLKEPVTIVKPILPAPILHEPILPIVKTPILPGPILPRPILNEPYLRGPILPRPILNEPYLRGPILPGPILQEPILKGPILPGPIYKSGPIYSEPLGPLPIYKAPLPLIKEQLPLYPAPLPAYKELPLIRAPLPLYKDLPLYKEQVPLYREPLPALPLLRGPIGVGLKGPLGPWESLGKGPISSLDWEGRGIGPVHVGEGPRGYLEKGLGWNGPLDYPLYPGGYKH